MITIVIQSNGSRVEFPAWNAKCLEINARKACWELAAMSGRPVRIARFAHKHDRYGTSDFSHSRQCFGMRWDPSKPMDWVALWSDLQMLEHQSGQIEQFSGSASCVAGFGRTLRIVGGNCHD